MLVVSVVFAAFVQGGSGIRERFATHPAVGIIGDLFVPRIISGTVPAIHQRIALQIDNATEMVEVVPPTSRHAAPSTLPPRLRVFDNAAPPPPPMLPGTLASAVPPPSRMPRVTSASGLRAFTAPPRAPDSVGATSAEREMKEKVFRQRWTNRTCETGVRVNFRKVDNFAGTLGALTRQYRAEATMLAFDMDGTLSDMKEKHTTPTFEALESIGGDMTKVVITARRNTAVMQCDTVLTTLLRPPSGSRIQSLFGLPNTCPREGSFFPLRDSRGQDLDYTFQATEGLIMAEYRKAEGLITYLTAREGGTQHVVFYDDYVENVVAFAEHLCSNDSPRNLKEVTAVWYATEAAQEASVKSESQIRADTSKASFFGGEDSYFSADKDTDAQLAGNRALFGATGHLGISTEACEERKKCRKAHKGPYQG